MEIWTGPFRIFAAAAMTGGNFFAWNQSSTAGTIATVGTTLSLVVIGAVAHAIQKIGPAWEEYWTLHETKKIEREKLREAVLFDQIVGLVGDLNRTRSENERLRSENDRLTNQLDVAIILKDEDKKPKGPC